jgi:hypothetical protein
VPQPEPAKDSAAKNSVVKSGWFFDLAYINGLGTSVVKEAVLESEGSPWVFRYGPGAGMLVGNEYASENDSNMTIIPIFFPIFFNAHLGLQKGNLEYFLDNRLGVNILCVEELACFFYVPII